MSETCEACGQTTGYNGHPNYETWAVSLWLSNDQGTYGRYTERAKELLARDEDAWNPSGLRMVSSADAAMCDLADELAEALEEEGPDLGASLHSDLLTAALSSVDWRSVAEGFVEVAVEEVA